MPVVRLFVIDIARPSAVVVPAGGTLDVPKFQLRCVLDLPGLGVPVDAIIDTGAALTFVPESVWQPLRPGTHFEWLPFAAGTGVRTGQFATWSFAYRMARFLAPVAVMDYSTDIERADVIAAFADSDPPASNLQKLPPVVVGLWGGLLEGGRLHLDRDPATGRVVGELAYP